MDENDFEVIDILEDDDDDIEIIDVPDGGTKKMDESVVSLSKEHRREEHQK